MTGKDIETDPQPKWLRPIDPLLAAGLPIRIDPRLGVDDDTAYRLQRDAEPLLTVVTVFVTSNYDNVLAAEVTDDVENGPHVLVRAATGDEAAYLLSPDDEQNGDCPESAGRDITWQQAERFRGCDGARGCPLVGRGVAEKRQGFGGAFLHASVGGRGVGVLDWAKHAAGRGVRRATGALAVR